MSEVTQRTASLSDLKDVWGLLREAAAEIPFDLENEAAHESVLSELMACCTSGMSPIAVDGRAIVGALLARRDDFEWGFCNNAAIHVSYAAIAPNYKDNGLLKVLVTELKGRKVPVLVSVKSGNRLGLVDELKALGFTHECSAESGWGDLYKWQPSKAN